MNVTVVGRWGGCCRAGEACAGYLVREGDATLLLDCGSGVAGRVQQVVPLEAVNDVIVSHWHADHCADAGVLLHGRLIQTLAGLVEPGRELRFYAPPHDCDLARLQKPPYVSARAIDEGDELRIGPFACTFLRTQHPVLCLATKVRARDGATFVFTADGALTDRLVSFCKDADLVVAECSLYAGVDGAGPGHMNACDAAELGRRAGVRTLVLSHLPIYGDVAELLSSARTIWDGDVRLAGNMQVYEVEGTLA